MNSNPNILITGASGYLGGRIIEHLTGFEDSNIITLSRKELPEIFETLPLYKSINGNLTDSSTWEQMPNLDHVIHLAAPNEVLCAEQPLECIETHLSNTWKLTENALKKGMNRMIYISTAHVYGSNLKGIVTEETLPIPNHPYALMHHAAEESLRYLSEKSGFELIIFRLSNAFGAPFHPFTDRWKLLVNDLCREVAEKGSITLKSAGNQKRNFIPITVVTKVLRMIITDKIIFSGTYNLCSDQTISLNEMADKIEIISSEILRTKIKRINLVESINEPPPYNFSNAKLTSIKLFNEADENFELKNLIHFCSQNLNQY